MSVLRSGIAITPLLVSGCNGVLWGNLGVLGVTVAIFLGTVFLGRNRTQQPPRSSQRPSASASFSSRADEPRASSSHHS